MQKVRMDRFNSNKSLQIVRLGSNPGGDRIAAI
jgi:hypothetical protein